MSDIMLKTLSMAADALAGKQIPPNLDIKHLVSAITNDQQKQVDVITRFITEIGKHFHSSSISQKRKHLMTIVYCCQLESIYSIKVKDALSSIGKHVITFIEQAKTVFDKRIGYLCLSSLANTCLSDIAYLSVNTIIKDIASKDENVIKIALQSVPQLVLVDLVPILFPIVEKRLAHNSCKVKSQAAIALEAMHGTAPEFVQNTKHHVKLLLADRDPMVMAAALPYICKVIERNCEAYPKMGGKLLFILKQVVNGNLPLSMTSHGIVAPWVQIRILKIIPKLKIEEEKLKELSDVFQDILNRCHTSSHLVAFAVAYQCICAIVHIFTATDPVFQQALSQLSTFMSSTSANLLLTGLELLTKISLLDPLLCNSYQEKIVECLSHVDLSIQKQTLNLLENLMNKENHQAVSRHMISQLARSQWSKQFVQSSSEKIACLVEKFSNDDNWLLETFHLVLTASRENAPNTLFPKVINCITKASKEVKQQELQRCLGLRKISSLHFKIVAWELAHLAKLCESAKVKSITDVLFKLCSLLDRRNSFEECYLTTILTVAKLSAINSMSPESVMQPLYSIGRELMVKSCTVNQKLHELKILLENQQVLKLIKDIDRIEFESDMDFLNDFISESRERHKNVNISLPPDTPLVENPPAQLKISVKQKGHQVKTTTSFLASTLPQQEERMQESFLSKSLSAEEQPAKLWGKQGFLGPKDSASSLSSKSAKDSPSTSIFSTPDTTASSNPPTLNEALQNLSVIAQSSKEDRAMLDMMNDMLMTSQSDSDVTVSPYRFPPGNG